MSRSAEEVRLELGRMLPEQWVVMIEVAESMLDDYGFDTLAEFITTPFMKGGLGLPLDKAKELIAFNPAYKEKTKRLFRVLGIRELAKGVDAVAEHGGARKQDYNSKDVSLHGNKSRYRIAKLKRDYPGIAQRLVDGEFGSVSAAEREAGVRGAKMTPIEKLVRAYGRLSGSEQVEFRGLI